MIKELNVKYEGYGFCKEIFHKIIKNKKKNKLEISTLIAFIG